MEWRGLVFYLGLARRVFLKLMNEQNKKINKFVFVHLRESGEWDM